MKTEILNKSSCEDFAIPWFVKGKGPVRPVLGHLVALPGFHLAVMAPVVRERFYTSIFDSARNPVRDGLN
jgi:hypothetical protein